MLTDRSTKVFIFSSRASKRSSVAGDEWDMAADFSWHDSASDDDHITIDFDGTRPCGQVRLPPLAISGFRL